MKDIRYCMHHYLLIVRITCILVLLKYEISGSKEQIVLLYNFTNISFHLSIDIIKLVNNLLLIEHFIYIEKL